ncbi:Fc.00g080680.m01.CDS01 [Cosmosporella sp. VM-42]
MTSNWPEVHAAAALTGWPMNSIEMDERSPIDINDNSNIHKLDHGQIYTLHVVSVTLSALSLATALVASSWFYRMRRSFRHDLIMLLIHCDIFKSIWFLAFPAVELVYGTIRSESAFCQASGFFLAVSIEASDIAVAMMALHTALYIFRGKQGLYPYRKIAYSVFGIFPILTAALAFINSPGYVNTGNFCYLPVEPVWTRSALSWIPRYIAFGTILLTYLSIYIYVRLLIHQFGNIQANQRRESVSRLESSESPRKRTHIVPPTPSIACHGLISSAGTSNRTSRELRGRQFSVVSTISTLNMDTPKTRFPSRYPSKPSKIQRKSDSSVNWKMPNFGLEIPAQDRLRSEPDFRDPVVANYIAEELATPPEVHLKTSKSSLISSKSATPPTRSSTNTEETQTVSLAGTSTALPSRMPSLPQIISTAIRWAPSSGNSSETRPSVIQALTPLDAHGMIKTREKIRRQLRQLFIYPLVYIIVWILPFIVHLTSYGRGAPFGMVAASLVFVSLQGLADAIVFSLKESPWRHPQRKRPCNLRFWKRNSVQEVALNTNVGRTREEMLLDGRNARERRDAELQARRVEPMADRKTVKEWWDHDHHYHHG